MKASIKLILLSVLFIGCSTSDIVMNPKYDDKDFSGKTILIMPVATGNITIQNKDDVEDDFPEDKGLPENIIKEKLYNSVYKNVQASLKEMKIFDVDKNPAVKIISEDSLNYFLVTKKIGMDSTSYDFYIPRNEVLDSNNINADVVLVINKIMFGRNLTPGQMMYQPGQTISTPGGTVTMPGQTMMTNSTSKLAANFEFAIFDYNENEMITYGVSWVETSLTFGMIKSTWQTIFNQIANKIFDNTPFKWKGSMKYLY